MTNKEYFEVIKSLESHLESNFWPFKSRSNLVPLAFAAIVLVNTGHGDAAVFNNKTADEITEDLHLGGYFDPEFLER
jgi:hypothetical protein